MRKPKKLTNVRIQDILEFDIDAKTPPRSIMDALFKKLVHPKINEFYSKNGAEVSRIKKQGADILSEFYEMDKNNRPILEQVKVPIENGKVIPMNSNNVLIGDGTPEFKEESLPKMKEGKLREDALKALQEFHNTVIPIDLL